ncbi:hypothetical protein KDAU_69860 [Dictyobacter aurantiacus]|uniref:Uncharacterized protein n=1 Tax=Dictyobacter aurantiacus TaxID=1936993 RepID=A0A401ZS00_9CHLR|nr:hypothetical protein KDAU_69860 [Dictyobacter aurantiacus]
MVLQRCYTKDSESDNYQDDYCHEKPVDFAGWDNFGYLFLLTLLVRLLLIYIVYIVCLAA